MPKSALPPKVRLVTKRLPMPNSVDVLGRDLTVNTPNALSLVNAHIAAVSACPPQ